MTARVPTELTCKEIVELVTDYLEGRMSLEDRSRFEQHLTYCSGCSSYLQQIRQTMAVTGAVQEDALTPEMQEDLVRLFRGWKGKK
jgi:predicted anti-sigma-YlaC factor YlaD